MIRPKMLALAVLLVLFSSATSAEGPATVIGRLTNSSFSIDIPKGWEMQTLETNHNGATPLFDLVPVGSAPAAGNPAVTFYIRALYYTNRVPSAAKLRWDSTGPPMSELPRINGLPYWSIFTINQQTTGRRKLTTFAPVGGDVVLFDLNAPDEARFAQGKQVLLEILRSYKEVRVAN